MRRAECPIQRGKLGVGWVAGSRDVKEVCPGDGNGQRASSNNTCGGNRSDGRNRIGRIVDDEVDGIGEAIAAGAVIRVRVNRVDRGRPGLGDQGGRDRGSQQRNVIAGVKRYGSGARSGCCARCRTGRTCLAVPLNERLFDEAGSVQRQCERWAGRRRCTGGSWDLRRRQETKEGAARVLKGIAVVVASRHGENCQKRDSHCCPKPLHCHSFLFSCNPEHMGANLSGQTAGRPQCRRT